MGVLNIISQEVNVIPCDATLSTSGSRGVYEIELNLGEETGIVTLDYNAQGVPDRFEVIYNGNVVADSKYVGNDLSGTPPTYAGLIANHEDLPVNQYDGTQFNLTGELRDINITQSDIADGSANEPTAGAGTIFFNKATAQPTNVLIRVTGPTGGTAWNINSLSCPQLAF